MPLSYRARQGLRGPAYRMRKLLRYGAVIFLTFMSFCRVAVLTESLLH